MDTFRTSQPVSAADASRPHIVLVGLPGAGKSVIGARVAQELGRSFLDFDTEIERRQSRTVAEIFAENGQPYFRSLEHELTQELAELGGMVVAPGGGWIVEPANLALLEGRAAFVWLKVSPEVAIARVRGDARVRPLLMHPDPLGELRKLLAQRETLYAQAHHVIDTEKTSVEEAAAHVAALARNLRGA